MSITFYQWSREFKKTGKTYFHFSELQKLYPSEKESLKVLLSRWSKQGLIERLGRGYYAFELSAVDYLQFSQELIEPSYLSFEYALFYHHLLEQIPSTVTLATVKRGQTIPVGNWTFEYSHLKQALFFGFEMQKDIYVATREKALCDLLYLMSRGIRSADLTGLEAKSFQRKRLVKMFASFPPSVKVMARSLHLV